jgi:hypothetical protein
VPPSGVDDRIAALVGALRANGIAVSCLGGDPTWTVDHDAALNWAARATADVVFDGVHLEVEPWALPRWPQDARTLMVSYATLVEKMAEVAPLAVDIVPWLVDSHSETVSHVVHQCDTITVPAYRDRAARILTDSRGIHTLCEASDRRYRIGVETQPPSSSIPSDTTFGDDGEAVLRRQLAAVAGQTQQPLFDRFAVHHLGSWRPMPPVTIYSRPADTQLMSWNRFPDTAFAAVSSAPS